MKVVTKMYKKKWNHYLRLAKRSYYEVKFKTLKNNIKGTWNILNQIINRTTAISAQLPAAYVLIFLQTVVGAGYTKMQVML